MATSSFTQNFKVTRKSGDAFVKLMSNPIPPTLEPNFESKIWKAFDVQTKEKVERALSK